jgi:hypothetical protein
MFLEKAFENRRNHLKSGLADDVADKKDIQMGGQNFIPLV